MNFTWVTLGSPGQQYGFSHTKMYFSAARQTCAELPGVARLASLDTHFHDVVQYIFHNYPDRQFWVDCTRVDKRESWQHETLYSPFVCPLYHTNINVHRRQSFIIIIIIITAAVPLFVFQEAPSVGAMVLG